MDIKTLLKMGMDEAIEWLIENESNYDLIKRKEGGYEFSFGFNGNVVRYNTADELGRKCAEIGSLSEYGGNPYYPDTAEYHSFNSAVAKVRRKQRGQVK